MDTGTMHPLLYLAVVVAQVVPVQMVVVQVVERQRRVPTISGKSLNMSLVEVQRLLTFLILQQIKNTEA